MATRVVYGNTTSAKRVCKKCGLGMLTIDEEFECDCGHKHAKDSKLKETKIEIVRRKRNKPSAWLQKSMWEEQEGRCYWCDQEIGMPYWKRGKLLYLRKRFDHKVPFSYEQRSRDSNWCIACNVCNGWKSNYLFKTEEECREYLTNKWYVALHRGKIITFETIETEVS